MSPGAESPRTRTRNRRGQGDLLRSEILAAATDLLDARGDGRAVTLRAVARRVGIAPPSIYPHFLDRPAMLRAVVHQAFAELSGQLRTAVAEVGEDPRRRLYAVCDSYLGFAHSHPQRYRSMVGVLPEEPVTLGADMLRILTDSLAACVDAGQSTSEDPATDALALWLGLHGLAHQRAVMKFFRWPADITQRIATSLSHLNDNRR